VWIATQTSLPLKRVIAPVDPDSGRIIETYHVNLNPKIYASAFEVPP
jgi:hypothetical protein